MEHTSRLQLIDEEIKLTKCLIGAIEDNIKAVSEIYTFSINNNKETRKRANETLYLAEANLDNQKNDLIKLEEAKAKLISEIK